MRIELDPAVDPSTPVGELFADGPIEISVTRIHALNVQLGISASRYLRIVRGELGTLS